eukprot:CAMPEP_0170593442 /NCGR_PEP_ID=MMETSP0224-20130122/13451_1 /TAXON_ID=285029 /ORGANISM="Togula jolla, Strain CCCM 725" /LENGTH=158 /DNA_ID=CAMNT_0010917397 /DNA_START=90 /DNA_END=567 /DNA_ORIENTATION=+
MPISALELASDQRGEFEDMPEPCVGEGTVTSDAFCVFGDGHAAGASILPEFSCAKLSARLVCSFCFFRALSSPSEQRWQNAHSCPLRQLFGFQYQAQGLHWPEPWEAEPLLTVVSPGGASRPGGQAWFSASRCDPQLAGKDVNLMLVGRVASFAYFML